MELIVLVAGVFLISMLPGIGAYFSLFYTMLHESCHALVARLSGGRVKRVHLYHTTAGMAETTHRSRTGAVLTTMAGYPLASLIVTAAIYAYVQGFVAEILWVLAAMILYQLIFWVRNRVGFLWSASVLAGLFALYQWGETEYFDWAVRVVLIVLWSQAFFSTLTVFRVALLDKTQAGDAAILARQTRIPTIIWGVFFAVQGMVFFIAGLFLWLGEEVPFDIVFSFVRM